jgi:inner membrane protein
MASAFAHVVVPATLYLALKSPAFNWRLLLLGAFMSVLPDADVAAFHFGIPYASQWGHRGFTHSISVALVLALLASHFANKFNSKPLTVFIVSFVSCLSHAALDALTSGGLGVALYWPFSHERIFADFRPIRVSPIGIKNFFTARGWTVIASELQWVLLPCIALGCVLHCARRLVRAAR